MKLLGLTAFEDLVSFVLEKIPEANHFLKTYAEFHKQHEATASALDCLMFFFANAIKRL